MNHERIMKRNLLGYLFALTLAVSMLFGMTLTVAAATDNAEVMSRFTVDAQGDAGDNHLIYCLGTDNWNGSQDNYTQAQVNALDKYLDTVEDEGRPIIILTHFPLHAYGMGGSSSWGYGGRQTTNADKVIETLNDAVADGKKIVLLWGHNHSYSDTNYDQIFNKGTSLEYASGKTKSIDFIYAAAGCMSDDEYGSGSHSVKGKGLIITIDNTTRELDFHYFDDSGNDVTEDAEGKAQSKPFNVENPGANKTVLAFTSDIHNGGSVDSERTSVNRLKKWLDREKGVFGHIDGMGFCGDMGNGSANENQFWTYTDNVMKVVSDESIKGVYTTGNHEYMNGNFKRDAQGSGEQGGSDPIEIPEDGLVIEPSTSNPSQTVKIAKGEEFSLVVTNGSSTSAYNFTASLSNSSVASIDPTTQNIAAGAQAVYKVTGLTDGTVDITIKNDQSSSSYVRKAVIHLTVGEGGTAPVEPDPDADKTVSVTPSDDRLESSETIKVGDVLAIKVTNGSENSAYDFEATLSKDGVAKIEGNTTKNIEKGEEATFYVTGVADGNVDITIRNNNTQWGASYERISIIHLTVGEGGDTPPDDQGGSGGDAGSGDTYKLVSSITDGKEYLIVSRNTAGSGYALKNPGGTTSGAAINTQDARQTVTVYTDDNDQYIKTSETGIVWTATEHTWVKEGDTTAQDTGFLLSNKNDSLVGYHGEVLIMRSNSENNHKYVWNYTNESQLVSGTSRVNDPDRGNVYVVYYGNSTFNGTYNDTSEKVYIYEKVDSVPEPPVETTISLDQTKLPLKEGETATLTATVTPETVGIADWVSSDVSVADVSSLGEVKAVAEGTARITVKTTDGKEAYCDVTVTPVTTIVLDKTELGLKVGEEATLNATVTPDTVEIDGWVSSDTSVAKVDDGKVTAVAEGTAKITVKTKDGATAECAVTVTKKDDGQGGDTPGGDTPGGNTPGGNTPSGTTPGGTTPTKTDTNTTTVDPKVQPTADQIAKAPVNSSLPVIDMDKIKTVASAKKATMTIGLGKMDADYCQIEYRKAGASAWTSAWVKPSNEVTLKNMKKKSYYQFRFTTFKVVNGKWEKSKTSNTSYRWILNTKVKKVKAKGKTATVTWAKVKGAKGYWVQYSTDKTFVKNAKVVKINKAKTTSKKIKGLKKGKTYYVRVRPVTKKSGKQYLGIYSGYKKFKVKK